MVFVCVALRPFPSLSQDIEYRDLPELLESGVASFSRGDFPQAAKLFNAIRADYQEEPEWIEGSLPKKLLPLAGFASLKSGAYLDAAESLQLYLENYADSQSSALFARYALAISLHRQGDEDAARNAFEQLRSDAGKTAFRDMATLRQARLSSNETARELLLGLIQDPVSQRFAALARLDLIQKSLDSSDPLAASRLLLETTWSESKMPELATLSHLAFSIGDALLESHPGLALEAFRRVSPLQLLIEDQREQLENFRATIENRAPTLTVEQSLWSDFYRESLRKLERQLAELEKCPDYQDALALRKALSFAKLERPIEAWILLENLSLNAPEETAARAHLEWISIARSMQAWPAAAAIAQRYIQMYPDRDDANQALYWIAQSQIDAHRYEDAILSLQSLIERTTDDSLRASSRYLIGYALARLNRIDAAIDSFRAAAQLAPNKAIGGQAWLWIGICHFLRSDFEDAIAAFERIAAEPSRLFLHPEALYRKACCHFALEECEVALANLTDWFERYQDHPRSDEARLLQGDAYSELGRDEDALDSYQNVSVADRELRFQAVDGSVEILLSLDQPKPALALLETFASAPVPPPLAGVFANRKADCLMQLGKADSAIAYLESAVKLYGDERTAVGIDSLIERASGNDLDTLERWIAERKTSPSDTLLSRLRLRFSEVLLQQGHVAKSQLQTLKLASDFDAEHLPPECLVAAGLALLEIGSLDSAKLFRHTLSTFPDSEYSSLAHYGLALDSANRGETPAALAELARIDHNELPFRYLGRALLLEGRLFAELERWSDAKASYESVLSERSLKPNEKATALLGLAKIHESQGEAETAYACYQRIFTLYRAERDLVATSYLRCSQILSQLSRYEDAHSVCTEFLEQPDLKSSPEHPAILQLADQLSTRLAENDASSI